MPPACHLSSYFAQSKIFRSMNKVLRHCDVRATGCECTETGNDSNRLAEPVFVNDYGAQESIPRIRFRKPL